MSNWDFITGSQNRMLAWKNLRSQLTENLSNEEYLQQVVDFWSRAPLATQHLDFDDCQNWPDPWQLVHQGDFDSNSVSLAMLYTLCLAEHSRWDSNQLCLLLLDDHQKQQLSLCVDNTWLLGWEYKTIRDWSQDQLNFNIQRKYVYYDSSHIALIS